MCQPHPASLAWLLQPQRVRVSQWPLARRCCHCWLLFGTENFRNGSVCGTRQPSNQLTKKPLLGCYRRFLDSVLDGRTERRSVIFWFERLFDELRDPNVRKEAPTLSGCLGFPPKKS